MITIACATNDKIHFTNTHFGDATFYNIYEISNSNFKLMYTLKNSEKDTDEIHEEHGSTLKAKSMVKQLKARGVQVLMNRNFGPNIARMKTRFIPVITSESNLARGILKLVKNFEVISNSHTDGNDFPIIKL